MDADGGDVDMSTGAAAGAGAGAGAGGVDVMCLSDWDESGYAAMLDEQARAASAVLRGCCFSVDGRHLSAVSSFGYVHTWEVEPVSALALALALVRMRQTARAQADGCPRAVLPAAPTLVPTTAQAKCAEQGPATSGIRGGPQWHGALLLHCRVRVGVGAHYVSLLPTCACNTARHSPRSTTTCLVHSGGASTMKVWKLDDLLASGAGGGAAREPTACLVMRNPREEGAGGAMPPFSATRDVIVDAKVRTACWTRSRARVMRVALPHAR